jgi:electron transfer flavoprotein alpha subunit
MYNPAVYVRAIAAALDQDPPRLVLLGHTYFGIEMSSGLMASLNATLWSNCRSLEFKNGAYEVIRPVFGGGYESTMTISAVGSNVMTLQRGSAPVGSAVRAQSAPTVRLPLPSNATDTGIKVIAETKAAFGQDITKADVLVAVGRGIGQQDRLDAYRELASALGGSIASSRPLVDLGWLPVDFQVGLSGRTVQPKVYLACGISGSMQHLAGMRESKLIIAINQDADAPIFQYAHYGVVADINAVLPALTEQAKSSFGKSN